MEKETWNHDPMDVRRYGIVPNEAGARAANTLALQNLLDPTVTGDYRSDYKGSV